MKKLICVVTVLAASTAHAGTSYVDADAPLGGDGLGWNTAYQSLQDALASAVAGTEIRVAEGVYLPVSNDSPGDRAAVFQLINGVSLLGGFAGLGAPDPDARDIGLFITVLSGDLLGNDGPGFIDNEENSLHVLSGTGVDASAILDGFVITAGNADGDELHNRRGGGLFVQPGAPTIADCVFVRNFAEVAGGALFAEEAVDLSLTRCRFEGNEVSALPSGGTGGAVEIRDSTATIADCEFIANSAQLFGGALYLVSSEVTLSDCLFTLNQGQKAGAVRAVSNNTTTFLRCVFLQNEAVFYGGAIEFADGLATLRGCTFEANVAGHAGGAVRSDDNDVSFIQCAFLDNVAVAADGGALANTRGNSGPGCVSKSLLYACVLRGNTSGDRGGAIFSEDCLGVYDSAIVNNSALGEGGGAFINMPSGDNKFVVFKGSTVSGNTAATAAGIQRSLTSLTTIENCILWGNATGPGEPTEDDQFLFFGNPDLLSFNHNDVQGLTGQFGGAGNFDANPSFENPLADDFRLSPDSPCIDAGNNALVPGDAADLDEDGNVTEPTSLDIDGNPRFLDVPETPDCQQAPGTCGNLPVVDIGAYESFGGGCLALTSQEIVCNPDGTTFTVTLEGINACTGGTTQLSFTASDGAVGQELCFTVLVNNGGFCCSTEICVTIPDCPALSGTVYVDASNCPGPGDGSELDPFCSIQTAIDSAVATTEVVVLPGTYFETIDFLGKPITVRSTDPNDPDVVMATIIDGTGSVAAAALASPVGSSGATALSSGFPAIVRCESGEGPDTVLSGFVITGGTAEIGAMRNTDSSPTVTNCTFDGNVGNAAMHNEGGSPTVTGCTFSGNSGVGIGAGGMTNSNSSPTVTDCTFSGNSGGGAGGMTNANSSPTVTNCAFVGNLGTFGAGAMFNFPLSSPTVIGCTFIGNTGGFGGGMFNVSFSNPTVINCTFTGNSGVDGGGMANSNCNPTVTNCTFSDNSAGGANSAGSSGGGMSHDKNATSTVTSCVLWGDTPNEIGGVSSVAFSNIQGGYSGTGNIDADPLFVDPDNVDLRLQPGSPGIDAGDNTAVPVDTTTDLDGNPRFVDDPDTPDCPQAPGQCGDPPVVDMGAYEFQGDPLPARLGDIDGDGAVGIADFMALLAAWGACGEEYCLADLDLDGNVGITDFLILLGNWG